MRLACAGAALALLFAPGCDRSLRPPRPRIYAAWEEGLTLGYENPDLADAAQRAGTRQTVRVMQSEAAGPGTSVTKTFSTLSGQWATRVELKDGGVRLVADGSPGILLLPEGFPDRVSRWEARGSYNWVVGRASADLPGVRFRDPADAVGIWVESVSLADPLVRTRTLYLPDLGEAQTLAWVPARGRWAATNQLVTWGFTDVPASQNARSTGSPQ